MSKTAEKTIIKYQSEFERVLTSICEAKDKKPSRIDEVRNGQTDTLKRVVIFEDQSYFIKIGEKVDQENKIYRNKFFENNSLFLKPIEKFSADNVLVLPYFDGNDLEDDLIQSNITLNSERIEFLDKLLHKVFTSFWEQNLQKSPIEIRAIKKYIDQRIEPFFEERKELKGIFFKPVVYQINGEGVSLPSINEMVAKVLSSFSSIKHGLSSCVIGDFQPSNILFSEESLKIVDLSNGAESGDMALDLGKFFNFINRFYLIAQIRSGLSVGKINDIPREAKLEIKSINRLPLLQQKIVENLEEKISEFVVSQTGDYNFPDRLKLFKFITNLITTPRHVRLGVPLEKMLSVIVDSYYELESKVYNI